MILSARQLRPALAVLLGVVAAALLGPGCGPAKTAAPVKPRYETVPLRQVPAFMQGSLFEIADMINTEPFQVSGYGLVVGLSGTGGSGQGVPTTVREYMLDEMFRRGFGQASGSGEYAKLKPEQVLEDPSTAIVTVVGNLPPGARFGDRIDLYALALADSNTTSLAHGRLYRTDLRINGANPFNPRGAINSFAAGEGAVFVNPSTAMREGQTLTGTERASLRAGTVIGGGQVLQDRFLTLRLRQPEFRLAQAVAGRINFQFPKTREDDVQKAQGVDEAIVNLVVPRTFHGDWQHYKGVILHLYLNSSTEFASLKAKELVDEALKPDAPLEDISYCWEGLGKTALDYIKPLYGHRQADVSFAAARAGAFLGDVAAQQVLIDVAAMEDNPFQLNAIQTLGQLPGSPRLDGVLAAMLDSSNRLVRIEAYRSLVRHGSQMRIISQSVRNEFVLDYVDSSGPQMVYASRTGEPRIAIFGKNTALKVPLMFTAMESRLSIHSPQDNRKSVNIMYRDDRKKQLISAESHPDLREIIWRLGGGSEDGFRFGYADMVGVLQALSERQDLGAAFVLQDAPGMQSVVSEAPAIPDRGPATQPAEPGR